MCMCVFVYIYKCIFVILKDLVLSEGAYIITSMLGLFDFVFKSVLYR